MSCHDIGRGMNSVVREIVTLLDAEKISKEAAKTLILACIRGVYWCDGNDGEAIDYIHQYLCGNCLKKVPEGEKMYSIWDNLPYQKRNEVVRGIGKEFVSYEFCEECFEHILEKNNMKREDLKFDPDDECFSRGKYNNTNNGVPWPRKR